MGGISASNLTSVTIRFDGTLVYSNNMKEWPRSVDGSVHMCMYFSHISNVTFTSSGKGLIDGSGSAWWGIPFIGYLEIGENRPRLLEISNGRDIIIEKLAFKDSPYWTVWAHDMDGLTIRYVDVSARRDAADAHTLYDISAFNTDGLDVSGRNVHIHDCNIWNQDDCVCIKDGSENMLIERVNASGLGFTIGSIGGSTVRNITFRDCRMHKTVKGIYMKFRDGDTPSLIKDIL